MPASQQLCLEHLKQTLLAALLRPLLLAVASERPELGRGPRRGRRRGSWIDSRPYNCEMGSQTYERRVSFLLSCVGDGFSIEYIALQLKQSL
jgi:hypothetical protein